MTGAKPPEVNPDLATSALSKVAGGASLDTLSQAEKAAIGALPPSALADARARLTAPPVSGSKPHDTLPTDAAIQAGQAAAAPKVGSREWTLAQGAGPNNQPLVDTTAATTASAEGPLPTIPEGGVNLAALNMRAAPKVTPAPNPVTPIVPTPPPVLVAANRGPSPAPTPTASTPGQKPTGYDMARANEVISSMPQIPKNISKEKLANIISDVMDAVGGGMRAYGGVNSPTRLMKQGEINMQVAAEKQQAQNAANIEYEQKVKLLPVEAQNAIAQARAIGDIKAEQDIAAQYGIEKATEAIKTREIIAGKRPAIGSLGIAGQSFASGQ